LLISLLVGMGGCQLVQKEQPPAPVNNTPLVVDEAMQMRDWDRSTNYYANGATVAGGTAYVWEVADWANPDHRRFIDGPVAVLNFASMPVGLFVNSPFEKQVIRGETVLPTYTAQPPLPGEPMPVTETVPEVMDTPAPPAPAGEPAEPPVAPPAVETPPPPVETAPPPPPVETTPPPEPVTPVTPAPAPQPDPITPQPDPITPEPATPPPSAVEPVEPVTPVPPAPPAPPAPPTEPAPQ
jgi:hypothetical protein